MPRVYITEADRLVKQETKKLHAELWAEGVRNKDIAKWLCCSEQNICQHWKRCSFSFKQILIMRHELERLQANE